jgi:hypothetical protein
MPALSDAEIEALVQASTRDVCRYAITAVVFICFFAFEAAMLYYGHVLF